MTWTDRPGCANRGTLTKRHYIDDILDNHVRLFAGARCDQFIIMDDNARPIGPGCSRTT
jgi:hypothetical protein